MFSGMSWHSQCGIQGFGQVSGLFKGVVVFIVCSGLECWDFHQLCEFVYLVGLVSHKFSKLVYETMKTFPSMASYSSENLISTSFFFPFYFGKGLSSPWF